MKSMFADRTPVQLVSIRYQNVRSFYDTTLPLDNEKTLIVGRNHAGKTSAMLLLAWVINDAEPDRLSVNSKLTPEEQNLLLPARSARHKARRITLKVYIVDGRTARKYSNNGDHFAILRIGFRVSGTPTAFIQLGPAKVDSGSTGSKRAAELLEHIQDIYSVEHIPSARDATSLQFRNRFWDLCKDTLAERALHPGGRSGVTVEYKEISQATASLKKLTQDLLNPMLNGLVESLPPGMLRSPSLTFKDGMEQSVIDWIVDQIALKLVTGDHDDIGVPPWDVGAGLQSVLGIAVASVVLGHSQKRLIVAVEEPEAFLHPSLQRIVARTLLSSEYGYKTLISTHSQILVEEARYEDILLTVDRNIYAPKREEESNQNDIHTALLSGQGAEMIFATSILLVEGEGDRVFFESLRRRLAQRDESGRADNLFVIQVGGNTNFGPWIRLIHALNGGSGRPFAYMVAPDGDAISPVHQALNESNVSLPRNALTVLQNARNQLGKGNLDVWRTNLDEANEILAQSDFPLCFLVCDLEWAIFSNMSEWDCGQIADLLGIEFEDKGAFIKNMGSKGIDGTGSGGHKAPYMRKQIAEMEMLELASLSRSIRLVLIKWLVNAGFKLKEAKALIT